MNIKTSESHSQMKTPTWLRIKVYHYTLTCLQLPLSKRLPHTAPL